MQCVPTFVSIGIYPSTTFIARKNLHRLHVKIIFFAIFGT